MGSPTCLIDPAATVVLDTSAVINLIASGCAAEILQAVPNAVLSVDAVPVELAEGRRRGRSEADVFGELVSSRLIKIVTLGDPAFKIFESLIRGRAADTLEDGEAATIACAVERGAIPIIDERKALRICGGRFPKLRLGCTVDLFAHPGVANVLGRNGLAEAIVNALQNARMRVLRHHVDWVVALIGEEQAGRCTSLPRAVRCPAIKMAGDRR